MKFSIDATPAGDQRRQWVEEFSDEIHARAQIVRRGFTIHSVRLASDADETSNAAATEAARTAIEQRAVACLLTGAPWIAGKEIEVELGIVTAECCFGMNLFRDLFAGMRDIVGGRSAAVQKTLRDARVVVLDELKREAALVGGDAAIAVRLDYEPMSDGKMLLVVAQGTAVKLKT